MNTSILEILQSGADVTINVKATDLKEFGRYLIDTATEEYNTPQFSDHLLS